MFQKYSLLSLLVALGLLCASCIVQPAGSSINPDVCRLNGTNGVISAGIDYDYEPLATPAEAIKIADLIVDGEVIDVADGMKVFPPDFEPWPYTALQVRVDHVVDGDEVLAGDVIVVQIARGPLLAFEQVATDCFLGRTLLVLEDASAWEPQPNSVFENRPDGPLYIPYLDGAWFQQSEDAPILDAFVGIDELRPAWNAPASVEEMVALLEAVDED